MGSLTLQYPPMGGGSVEGQVEGLRRYLISLTEQLNGADWSAQAVLREVSQAIDESGMSGAERQTVLGGWASLRSLILKTADYAARESESFRAVLEGKYVAVSTFGRYQEELKLTLEANETAISQVYDYAAEIEDTTNQLKGTTDQLKDYTAGVNNKLTVNSRQYVKTGLLYYNGVSPVYGVGVGNIETTVSQGSTVLDRTRNELLTVTPGRLSFWQDGQEVAYLTDKKLHFPAGTLEAYNAVLTGTVTAAAGSSFGPWTVSETSIYRTENQWSGSGLYFGTEGLSIKDAFAVDAGGRLQATNAVVSGEIVATSGFLGNWQVEGDRLIGASSARIQIGDVVFGEHGLETDEIIEPVHLRQGDIYGMSAINRRIEKYGEGFFIPLFHTSSNGSLWPSFPMIEIGELINYIADTYTGSSGAEGSGSAPSTGGGGGGGTYANVCGYFGGSNENQIKTRANINVNAGTNTGDYCQPGYYYTYDQTMTVTDPVYGQGLRVWAANMVEYSTNNGTQISGPTGRSWANGSFFVQNGNVSRYPGVQIVN